MDDARVEEFVAEADSDGDGKVNREEFLQFCEASFCYSVFCPQSVYTF